MLVSVGCGVRGWGTVTVGLKLEGAELQMASMSGRPGGRRLQKMDLELLIGSGVSHKLGL